MKSFKNLISHPLLAYTSTIARSWELDPKIRSTLVAFHFKFPVFLSYPSNKVDINELYNRYHLTEELIAEDIKKALNR